MLHSLSRTIFFLHHKVIQIQPEIFRVSGPEISWKKSGPCPMIHIWKKFKDLGGGLRFVCIYYTKLFILQLLTKKQQVTHCRKMWHFEEEKF